MTSLLVLVYFIGRKHRWLQLGTVSLQPSEFAKPALIIFLAYFISHAASGDQRQAHAASGAARAWACWRRWSSVRIWGPRSCWC